MRIHVHNADATRQNSFVASAVCIGLELQCAVRSEAPANEKISLIPADDLFMAVKCIDASLIHQFSLC